MHYFKIIVIPFFFLIILISYSCGGSGNEKAGTQDNAGELTDHSTNDDVAKRDMPVYGSDAEKEEALREAALEGNLSLAERLISSGTDVNSSAPDDRTALMLASFNGHINIMISLLEAGANVDSKDEFGRTALMYASTGPFPNPVKLLLENGADPNICDSEEKFSPLMFAAAEGHMEVVNILLDNNADRSLKDKDGDTAESFARSNGHTVVADLLSKSY